MSLPQQCHVQQPLLLLVGAHTGISARLPTLGEDPLDVRAQTGRGVLRAEHVHLGRQCAVRCSPATQLPGEDGLFGHCCHLGAADEAFYHLSSMLAGRVLRLVPELLEWFGRAYEIWGSRVLYGLVEQSKCWRILADLE